jgi:predicted nucleotidyltransferase
MTLSYEQVKSRTILLYEYGSRLYGTDTEESDHDLMGIMVEPKEYVLGLEQFDQYQTVKSARSTVDDVDETIYSLRKWATLAAKGNPTVQMALFASSYEVSTSLGALIVSSKDVFLSKEAGKRYLGYMSGQRKAMTGERNKRTNRPELVNKYGYDTKFAYHMLRLGLQGVELMDTGAIELPMKPKNIEYLLAVRSGDVSLDEVFASADRLAVLLEDAINNSRLPEFANYSKVNNLLTTIYEETWKHDAH